MVPQPLTNALNTSGSVQRNPRPSTAFVEPESPPDQSRGHLLLLCSCRELASRPLAARPLLHRSLTPESWVRRSNRRGHTEANTIGSPHEPIVFCPSPL